jgi:hypothetical protein
VKERAGGPSARKLNGCAEFAFIPRRRLLAYVTPIPHMTTSGDWAHAFPDSIALRTISK